jgi:Flp pilus assembly pilin Flp
VRPASAMRRILDKLSRLADDERGQTTLEYAILIGAVGLPAIIVFGWLLTILSENYRMVTFLELLPFP